MFKKGYLVMSPMQHFHDRLFGSPEVYDPTMQGLARLTRTDQSDLVALETALDWLPWG